MERRLESATRSDIYAPHVLTLAMALRANGGRGLTTSKPIYVGSMQIKKKSLSYRRMCPFYISAYDFTNRFYSSASARRPGDESYHEHHSPSSIRWPEERRHESGLRRSTLADSVDHQDMDHEASGLHGSRTTAADVSQSEPTQGENENSDGQSPSPKSESDISGDSGEGEGEAMDVSQEGDGEGEGEGEE